ncbi:MAG: HD domain-containing protein [Burkholderiales bacterium]|nr:HD domain-containing protein [Burkholderiales bacterium]
MELQVIRAEQFPLGKPLPCNLYDRNGVLLLKAGEMVNSHRQLEELCVDGLFIPKQEKDEPPPEPPKQSPFVLLDALPGVVERLFGYMSVEPNFAGRTLAVAKTIQAACEIDRDACVAWVFIGPDVRYVIAHPLHTAILCELVARQLGWPPEERLSLLNAALSMNIGKLVLQHKLSILAKPLEPAQRVQMQAHCEQGVVVLQKLEVTDSVWLNAVAQHHERLDGSGYPRQLANEAISREARLIAVADVYTALVTTQAHHSGQAANAAFKAIYAQRGKQLDSQMTDTLIKVMGVFPPGCYVKLANGEIAVVARHGPTPTAPIVYSFINPRGQSVNVYPKRDCGHTEFAIKEVLIKSKVEVTLNHKPKLWGYKT